MLLTCTHVGGNFINYSVFQRVWKTLFWTAISLVSFNDSLSRKKAESIREENEWSSPHSTLEWQVREEKNTVGSF